MTTDIDAIRQREQAATEGPWFYNSYAGVFSTPKVALWDPWLDSVDDSHSMERHGRCEACGKDGCRLFSEAYNRDPLVAHVPAHHGDTATGMHAADAAFIAHARTDVPALLAKVDELTAELATNERSEDARLAIAEAELEKVRAQLTAVNRRNDGLQNDLNSATKANTAWANQDARLRKAAMTFRSTMIGQHEWGGHLIEGDCPDCIKAADELDGSLACDRYREWQRQYEDALGTYLPSGVAR